VLGTSPLAEADSSPFMTSGPDPLWVIYGHPVTPGFAELAQGVVGVRIPVALGWRSLAEADGGPIHDRWA